MKKKINCKVQTTCKKTKENRAELEDNQKAEELCGFVSQLFFSEFPTFWRFPEASFCVLLCFRLHVQLMRLFAFLTLKPSNLFIENEQDLNKIHFHFLLVLQVFFSLTLTLFLTKLYRTKHESSDFYFIHDFDYWQKRIKVI